MPGNINLLKNMQLDRKQLVNHQSFLSLNTKIVKITDIIKWMHRRGMAIFPAKADKPINETRIRAVKNIDIANTIR